MDSGCSVFHGVVVTVHDLFNNFLNNIQKTFLRIFRKNFTCNQNCEFQI